MECKELLTIKKIDDHDDVDVCIESDNNFKAVVVSLVSVLNHQKRLGIMVLAGMLERIKNPGLFGDKEIIVPGGMPWDTTQKRQENER